MGKSCVRLRKLEDIPLKVIGQAVKRVPVAKFIATYEAATGERRTKQSKTGAKKKTARKKVTTTRKPGGKKKATRPKKAVETKSK
jgi:hypothetical protein